MRLQIKIIVFLILLSLIIFASKYNDQESDFNIKQDTDRSYYENIETLNVEECWQFLTDKLIYGSWVYPGGDLPGNPQIELIKKNNFNLTYDYKEFKTLKGSWEYDSNKRILLLSFKNREHNWFSMLKNKEEEYEGVEESNYEEKVLRLKINFYIGDEDNFECKEDRFYINLFNQYLYKETS